MNQCHRGRSHRSLRDRNHRLREAEPGLTAPGQQRQRLGIGLDGNLGGIEVGRMEGHDARAITGLDLVFAARLELWLRANAW